MNRRNLLKNGLFGASALVLHPLVLHAAGVPDAAARLAALQRRHGGRLGVAVLDTGSGHRTALHGDERFLLCSTFKVLAVAAVLARVDAGQEKLDRHIVFGSDVLLDYAPVTRQHVGAPGMTVAELCAAAITLSDNTAANLLLASMGGPAAVTRFVRRLGDEVTRLDRTEPELNHHGGPGDVRDTTTPNAMLDTLQRLLLGQTLADVSRTRLIGWLRACTTGTDKLRASIPSDWQAGDKTGSGDGQSNDVAIFWPPRRKPILVTAYYAGSSADSKQRSAVLAEVGRIAASI